MTTKRNLILSIILAVLFCSMAHSSVYAQSTGIDQFRVNKSAIAKADPEKESTLSPELMSEQLRAQQLEIEELRDQVKKLEGMLATLAVNQKNSLNISVPASPVTPIEPSINSAVPKIRAVPATVTKQTVTELLPGLGHIGAEVGILIGGSQNPFKADEGFFAGGFIDLPLREMKGGKLSYEIMIGAQRTVSTQQTTSGVIALVNSALNNALGLPPSANNLLGPLPVTNRVKERLTVLTVVPASFKYTMKSLDKHNIRPYFVVGLGTYVGLSSQNPTEFDAHKYIKDPNIANLVNALLAGPQVGGLAPVAPELRERGLSAGQGDFRFGLNAGGGMEVRLSPRFSIGFDYRINKIEGRNGTFSTFALKQAIHW